jgi:predicted phage tail component-like protein
MMQNGGFVLGGVPAKELGIIMISSSRRPILPSTVDRTMTIPGRHGAWDFGADLGPRLFDIECAFVTTSPTKLQKAVSDLAAFLVDEYGRPRTMELTFSVQPERSYFVRYSGSLPIDRVIGLGRFTLPLIAYDPFAYAEATAFDVDPGEYDTGLDYDSGAIYPNTQSLQWQYTYHMSSLYNYGPLVTPLRLDIEGAFSNLTATNLNTGQSFTLSMTNPADHVVVVDARMMQVYQAVIGEETTFINAEFPALFEDYMNRVNKLSSFSGDFIFLQPGENKFVFQGESPDATIRFRWKHKFA